MGILYAAQFSLLILNLVEKDVACHERTVRISITEGFFTQLGELGQARIVVGVEVLFEISLFTWHGGHRGTCIDQERLGLLWVTNGKDDVAVLLVSRAK